MALQERLRDALLAGGDGSERLLLCEHEPVITLGRHADRDHLLASHAELAANGIAVRQVSRGGDVTYHGPGQLMVYPVVRIGRGVVAYLEALATALAQLAAELGAPGAQWRRNPAGLWLGDAKMAACGIHVRRGVAIHGFALDVATPPEAWRRIVPCGIGGVQNLSIARAAKTEPPPMREVARRAAPLLCAALGFKADEVTP